MLQTLNSALVALRCFRKALATHLKHLPNAVAADTCINEAS